MKKPRTQTAPTEAEAIGTIGIIDSPAAAYTVARLASLREVSWEIVTRHDPTSKEPWRACLEDVYRDTGERKSRAVVFCQTKEQAQAAAVSLHNAKQKEIADFLQQARDAAQLPPPPARCTPLGPSDRKDVQAARLNILRKRWPRCFAILDGKRSATVGEMGAAWRADAAEQTGRIVQAEAEPSRALEVARALLKAHKQAKGREAAAVMNWRLAGCWKGYCYLSAENLARVINKECGTTLSPAAAKKRRERLGLVTHKEIGPDYTAPSTYTGQTRLAFVPNPLTFPSVRLRSEREARKTPTGARANAPSLASHCAGIPC